MDLLSITELLSASIRVATPLILMALGSALCQKTGVFNIAFEGIALIGAFAAVAFVIVFNGNSWMGILGAVCAGGLTSLIYAVFVVHLKADYVIASIAVNMLGLGLTSYLLRAVFHVQGRIQANNIVKLPMINIPILKDIPILGCLSGQSIITYFTIVLVIAIYLVLFKTRGGLNICSVGESELAAVTGGISPSAVRMKVIFTSGALSGLAGAYLSIVIVSQFSENMVQGRGYNAFTAMVFGGAHPVASTMVCILFGFADAVGIHIELAGLNIPSAIIHMFPFLLALVALAISSYTTKMRLRGGNSTTVIDT
jgi:simple sugar transport system permease protein